MLDLFFRQLTDEQRASIRIVTGDGAKWIDASVKEHLPNAERVLDSFHIVSWMSDALDQVRNVFLQVSVHSMVTIFQQHRRRVPTETAPSEPAALFFLAIWS